MKNIPEIRVGLVAMSRDCFPLELSRTRRQNVAQACRKLKIPVKEIETVVEGEKDIPAVFEQLEKDGTNALVLYLGNFGPEGPTTRLAQMFQGPVMFAAAAEESGNNLIQGRGDAFCGLLNSSYNIGLRKIRPCIPEIPVGTPDEVALLIRDFIPIARIVIGVRNLRIFAFGPRPQDFLACHAPIRPLYDLGVEVMENSELDLFDLFRSAEKDRRIPDVAADMAKELGTGNTYPDLLQKLAQFEIALLDFAKAQAGMSRFGVFANKCWPSFEKFFGFVPCYVNSRLASRGIPVACEVDIYGALSEFMAALGSGFPPTLLDINNTVPSDMIRSNRRKVKDYTPTDLFMGFHCGNTPSCCMAGHSIRHQLIMHRLMEPDRKPDITRGTLEGRIRPGEITLFRLQGTPDAVLRAYAAEGEILDMDPRSFGGIGVFAVRGMGRFYRHVLIEKRFPHHTAVAFSHSGRVLFEALKMLGVEDISFPLPENVFFPKENPFSRNM